MAVDIFLKLGDIKGESVDAKHRDEIDIESFSFGQAGVASETGQRTAKVELQDFQFVIRMNRASPKLMERAANGAHIKNPNSDAGTVADATLVVRKAGADPVEFLKVKFYDVMISSYQHGGQESDPSLVDQFSLWFAKVELEYAHQLATGQLGPSTFFKYDRIKGETY
jgi:type VI secretion system secreted protein Hcp